tara:strand:+ start:480 stop:1004 length:525 start_codon:yes stop_codon:yes gene_type:complete
MIQETLFNIPYWTIPTLNFKEKKKKLQSLCRRHPEKQVGIQTFSTNRQTPRIQFKEDLITILEEELNMLSETLKKDIRIDDAWSVSYKKGEYHSPHNHGSLGLSGILYLDQPKDAPMTHYMQPWNDYMTDRTVYLPLPIIEGTIVVVPQFIQHFSSPNTSKKIKRIISWDLSLV